MRLEKVIPNNKGDKNGYYCIYRCGNCFYIGVSDIVYIHELNYSEIFLLENKEGEKLEFKNLEEAEKWIYDYVG